MCYGPDTKETGRKMAAYVDTHLPAVVKSRI